MNSEELELNSSQDGDITLETTHGTAPFYNRLLSEETQESIKEKSKVCYDITKNKLYHLFTDHPRSKNMTYFQHFTGSFTYFGYSYLSSLIFLIHSLFPFLFQSSGSQLTQSLYKKLLLDGNFQESEEENLQESDEEDNDGEEEDNDGEEEDNDGEEENHYEEENDDEEENYDEE
jgi:Family of unknown function (DUF6356)